MIIKLTEKNGQHHICNYYNFIDIRRGNAASILVNVLLFGRSLLFNFNLLETFLIDYYTVGQKNPGKKLWGLQCALKFVHITQNIE